MAIVTWKHCHVSRVKNDNYNAKIETRNCFQSVSLPLKIENHSVFQGSICSFSSFLDAPRPLC